jgi:hypothetical protein
MTRIPWPNLESMLRSHILADKRVSTPGMIGYALRNVTGLAGRKEIRMCAYRPRSGRNSILTSGKSWQMRLKVEKRRRRLLLKAMFFQHGGRGCSAPRPWSEILTQPSPRITPCCFVLSSVTIFYPSAGPSFSIALGFPTVVHSARDMLENPVSWLALEFRRVINKQGTRAQVEAYAALQRTYSVTMRTPILFGDSGMYNIFFSNWQKAGLFGFDFAAAATEPRKTPLRASYIQCVQDPAFPEGWPIGGKDNNGNYWNLGFRVKGLWVELKEERKRQLRDQTK